MINDFEINITPTVRLELFRILETMDKVNLKELSVKYPELKEFIIYQIGFF